jgi:hypothetical protein
MEKQQKSTFLMTTCGSTVVEQLIHDPNIEVLSLASTESIFIKLAPPAQTQRDNQFDATMGTASFTKYKYTLLTNVENWI